MSELQPNFKIGGEADGLTRAKNTSIDKLSAQGLVYAQKGVAHLVPRNSLPEEVKSNFFR
jgi:hypothetical protein